MAGELFLPHDMPEPPKLSFFSGLFGGGSRSLDREELCKFKSEVKTFHKISFIEYLVFIKSIGKNIIRYSLI